MANNTINKNYARLKNGKLEYATKQWTTDEGKRITNFTKNEAFMLRYGFKRVIDEVPEYDFMAHYIEFREYVEDETTIRITYDIFDYDMSIYDKAKEEEE